METYLGVNRRFRSQSKKERKAACMLDCSQYIPQSKRNLANVGVSASTVQCLLDPLWIDAPNLVYTSYTTFLFIIISYYPLSFFLLHRTTMMLEGVNTFVTAYAHDVIRRGRRYLDK